MDDKQAQAAQILVEFHAAKMRLVASAAAVIVGLGGLVTTMRLMGLDRRVAAVEQQAVQCLSLLQPPTATASTAQCAGPTCAAAPK